MRGAPAPVTPSSAPSAARPYAGAGQKVLRRALAALVYRLQSLRVERRGVGQRMAAHVALELP